MVGTGNLTSHRAAQKVMINLWECRVLPGRLLPTAVSPAVRPNGTGFGSRFVKVFERSRGACGKEGEEASGGK